MPGVCYSLGGDRVHFRDRAAQGHCVAEDHPVALSAGPRTEMHPDGVAHLTTRTFVRIMVDE